MIRRLPALAVLVCATSCASPQPVLVPAPPSTSEVAPSTTVAPPVVITPTVTSPPSVTVTPTITALPTTVVVPPSDTRQVEITWYGSWDNDPHGSLAIDSPVIHKTAGGTGTWADPLTFASPVGPDGKMAYAVGARIYVPSVQKYFIREDSCAVSWTAPNGCGALTHVDLYIGNPSGTKDVLKCEDALTPNGNAPIVVNPALDLPVDAAPLWVEKTKACHVR